MNGTKMFRSTIEKLAEKHHVDLSAREFSFKVEVGTDAILPLVIDSPLPNVLRVGQYGRLNGDLMADPEMWFYVNVPEDFGWIPVEWTNHYAYGAHTVASWIEDGEIKRFSPKGQKELCTVANQWARNIKEFFFDDDVKVTYVTPQHDPDPSPIPDPEPEIETSDRPALYEQFKKYAKPANSLEDFLSRYYKPDRYTGRGDEYVTAVQVSCREDIQKYGYTFISHHSAVTGEICAYYPPLVPELCPECEPAVALVPTEHGNMRCPTCGLLSTSDEGSPEPDLKKSAMFEKLAAGMDKAIEQKFADRLTNTYKRQQEDAYQRKQGRQMQQVQAALRGLSVAWAGGAVPSYLIGINAKNQVEILMTYEKFPASKHSSDNADRLTRAGITSENYGAAREFILALVGDAGQENDSDKIRKLEAEAMLKNIPGFFPTPPAVVQQMIELANLQPGMTVLEPSAGAGAIADAGRDARCQVDCCEISLTLSDLLKMKGHSVLARDFFSVVIHEDYDRVLMNPPFENRAELEHVQRAYAHLRPGGKLVSVVGAGIMLNEDNQAKQFQSWLANLGAYIIDLPDGAFQASGTSVRTKLVVIKKPASSPEPELETTYVADMQQIENAATEIAQVDPSDIVIQIPSKADLAMERIEALDLTTDEPAAPQVCTITGTYIKIPVGSREPSLHYKDAQALLAVTEELQAFVSSFAA